MHRCAKRGTANNPVIINSLPTYLPYVDLRKAGSLDDEEEEEEEEASSE